MPTYEFKCKKCSSIMEIIKSYKDPSPQKCPQCGGRLVRIYQPAGIIFKGSGFYKTDYCRTERKGKTQEKGEEKSEKTKESVA
jgi:putative FmdB family regulatory protein